MNVAITHGNRVERHSLTRHSIWISVAIQVSSPSVLWQFTLAHYAAKNISEILIDFLHGILDYLAANHIDLILFVFL